MRPRRWKLHDWLLWGFWAGCLVSTTMRNGWEGAIVYLAVSVVAYVIGTFIGISIYTIRDKYRRNHEAVQEEK